MRHWSISQSEYNYLEVYGEEEIDRRPTADFLPPKGPLRTVSPERWDRTNSVSAADCWSDDNKDARSPSRSMTRQHVLWLATPMFEPDRLQARTELMMPQPDRVSMQGWLKKQKEGVFGHWRERWCVIYESGLFRYYCQPPVDGELHENYRKGKGDVSFLHLKTFGREDNFVWVGTRERMWRFDAGSEENSQLWLDAMTAPYQRFAEEELKELLRYDRSGTQLSFSGDQVEYAPLIQPPRLGTKFRAPSPSKSRKDVTFIPVYRSASILRTTSEPCLKALETTETREKSLSETRILKEGWLMKKGGTLGIWRRRWCVLYECGIFRYYTKIEKSEGSRKGKGDASFATICDGSLVGKEFSVQTDERLWEFQVDTLCEAADWFDKFNTPYRNQRIKKARSMIFRRDSESFSVWGGKNRSNSESKLSLMEYHNGMEHSLLE